MTAEERKRFEKLEDQIFGVRKEMDQRNGEMRKFMYDIKNSLDDLTIMLRGDAFGNSDGLVKDVKSQGNRIKKLEMVKNKLIWVLTGTAIPSSYGIWEFIKKMFPPFIILILFTSCLTNKKKEDIAHRYFRQNPIELAKLSSLHYPVQAKQGKVVFDTLRTILRDSVDCPDSTRVACPPCEQKIVTGLRVDTVPDLALVAALKGDLNNLQIKEAVLQSDKDRMKKKIRNLTITVIGLGIALIGAAYLIFKP